MVEGLGIEEVTLDPELLGHLSLLIALGFLMPLSFIWSPWHSPIMNIHLIGITVNIGGQIYEGVYDFVKPNGENLRILYSLNPWSIIFSGLYTGHYVIFKGQRVYAVIKRAPYTAIYNLMVTNPNFTLQDHIRFTFPSPNLNTWIRLMADYNLTISTGIPGIPGFPILITPDLISEENRTINISTIGDFIYPPSVLSLSIL
jgi:hypothetical protein